MLNVLYPGGQAIEVTEQKSSVLADGLFLIRLAQLLQAGTHELVAAFLALCVRRFQLVAHRQ
ncbi:hypothetical protein BFR06_17990 [Burkholderia pseudomallei]|nr:hypothetical protein A7U58_15290 [Burkholderia pseudomallei]KEO70618.1 hypothetical protein J103_02875 [Burkholderia pseudomallei MSHR5855]ANW57318.1 hypothetical protein A7U59_15265 [Burkholderia pseudomallei]APF93543.1 hypothetical protein BFR05_17980 [Burkholderia pseudomallei]APF99584.1 hypothetical protein BFR06_17990 [Burkholderia pseudomallei]